MAVGTQFSALVDMLREEAGLSTNVGVGVDATPGLQRHINRAYAILLAKEDWPHLRYVPPRISLQEGERFYDLDEFLEPTSVSEIDLFRGNVSTPVDRGISAEQYTIFDSENDARSSPVMRWDFRHTGTAAQIEVWPTPADNEQSLMMVGRRKVPRLINDTDLCQLDDDLVVLAAAVRILKRQGSADADDAVSEFQSHLASIKANRGPSLRVTMGGSDDRQTRSRVTLAVR